MKELDLPLICDLSTILILSTKNLSYLRESFVYHWSESFNILPQIEDKIQSIYSNSQLSLRGKKIWENAVIEEILLAKIANQTIPPKLLKLFQAKKAFYNSRVILSDLLQATEFGVATFPLDSPAGDPLPARIWVFKSKSKFPCNLKLDGYQEVFPPNSPYYAMISSPIDKFRGTSWQLAAKLVIKAIEEKNLEHVKNLALKWIISGSCSDREITDINLGKKLALQIKNRNWIIPRDNLPSITRELYSKLHIRTARDIDEAWNRVKEQGHNFAPPLSWSNVKNNCDELHISFGQEIKAAVLSTILLTPKIIFPWITENVKLSEKPFEEYKKVLQCLNLGIEVANFTRISSSQLHETEKLMIQHFEEKKSKKIIFNITSGNRLVSFAAQTIARLYPNVQLIYRELDSPQGEFIYFNYHDFPPDSGIIQLTDSNLSTKYNLEFLCSRERYENSDDFVAKLIKS